MRFCNTLGGISASNRAPQFINTHSPAPALAQLSKKLIFWAGKHEAEYRTYQDECCRSSHVHAGVLLRREDGGNGLSDRPSRPRPHANALTSVGELITTAVESD